MSPKIQSHNHPYHSLFEEWVKEKPRTCTLVAESYIVGSDRQTDPRHLSIAHALGMFMPKSRASNDFIEMLL